jgi:hypothetical protein
MQSVGIGGVATAIHRPETRVTDGGVIRLYANPGLTYPTDSIVLIGSTKYYTSRHTKQTHLDINPLRSTTKTSSPSTLIEPFQTHRTLPTFDQNPFLDQRNNRS